MTVNTAVKVLAIRYGLGAVLACGLLFGCVYGTAFVWQKLDNRGREVDQEQIDAKYLPAAQEASRRGDRTTAERLMQEYREAIERHYAD